MKPPRPLRVVLNLTILLLFPLTAVAEEFKIKTLELDDVRVIYFDRENEYILPHLTRCFRNSLNFHSQLFDYTPNEQVTVILRDFNDHGYAGATSVPINYLILGIEPFEQVYETSPTNERLNWVMSHELLHVVASDQATSRDRFFRKLFAGKVLVSAEDPITMLYAYLTSPRTYSPRWYHEGMAVFMETWMAGGYGRAIGGYDEMVFRTMVAEDEYFYDVVGLESEGKTTDFQLGQMSYLYGTRFVTYLAHQYGPQGVIDWLNRTDGSKRTFGAQFKNVYGNSLDREWKRWIEWEHEWQRTNLDTIRQYETTPYRELTDKPLGSVSRAYFDAKSRRLYTAVLYPGELAHVAAIDIDTWQSRKITEIPTPALYFVCSLAFDDSTGSIFFTTDNGETWRDLNVVDIATRKARSLIKDIRTGDICFNRADGSIWGIRHHNGLSRIVALPAPYGDAYEVLTLPYGRDFFDIDVSPDGRYLTGTLIEVSGRQRLVRMSTDRLTVGDGSYEVLYEFPNYSPANFVFSPDGRYLFGTTYSTGVSNVTRYDFESGRMDWITNGDTGYFRPVPISEDSLIAFRYTADGFMPVMIPNEPLEDVAAIRFLGQAVVDTYPNLRQWMLAPPSSIELDSLALVPKDYGGIKEVGLQSVYPVIESYKDRVAVGLRLNFMDPLWLHGIELSASWTPEKDIADDEKGHARLRYTYYPWELNAWYNRADFYDFFGPTKRSRKGYSVGVSREGTLIHGKPRKMEYSLALTGYAGLDRLPDAQNVAAPFSRNLEGFVTLSYQNHRRTIGGLEAEKGVDWRLNFLNNLIATESATSSAIDSAVTSTRDSSRDFPRAWGEFNLGFHLPWRHSSVWLRSSIGSSFKDAPNNAYANFFFGGFGNNEVDDGAVKRYREHYSFPGAELNSISGLNYGKLMAEWTLPPLRFRRVGFQSFYATWAHLAIFGGGIQTNFDRSAGDSDAVGRPLKRTLVNLGAQLDFKVVIFSTLSSTLSFGYAGAWEDEERAAYEFMVSLKIL